MSMCVCVIFRHPPTAWSVIEYQFEKIISLESGFIGRGRRMVPMFGTWTEAVSLKK